MAISGEIVGDGAGGTLVEAGSLPLSGQFSRLISRLIGYAALASVCALIVKLVV